jgi:YVTN family beta-propeller protein
LAVSPDGSKVYVTNIGSNTVSVINTATNTVMGTVAVGNSPHGVSVSPDGSKVYAANFDSATVSVINTATNTVTTTVAVGTRPHAFGNFIGPAPAAVPVPTLSQWALIALGLLLAGLAVIQFGRARSIQA